MSDVCLWPLDPGCLGQAWDQYPSDVRLRATLLASKTLTGLTAGRVGDCPVTVRPDLQNGSCGFWQPYTGGAWAGIRTGWNYDPREIQLPLPAYAVAEVRIDGVVVPPVDYKLFDNGILRYVGIAYTGWPSGQQNWNAKNNEPGYFAVTYLNTAPVDSEGQIAAGLLALEFAKACAAPTSGAKCRLPAQVTQIVRQGIAMDVVAGAFPDGLTAIREVDNYVSRWNRKGRQAATIIDPFAPNVRVETGVTGWTGAGDGILDGGTP